MRPSTVRRDFLKLTGLALVGATVFPRVGKPADAGFQGLEQRPNLLILHTDEHNFRTLGCYRALLSKEQAFVWGEGVAVETPNLDALAKAGALCARFYAASPVCTPSRASFVTGRYPQNTGAAVNDVPMRDDVVTFAEVLRRNGYATGYAGKWHLDGAAKPGWTPVRKFGFEDNKYMFNRGHWKKLVDTSKGPEVKDGDTYSAAGADEKSFTTDFLADKTVAFIRAHTKEPFCFMVSFPDPHGPNTVRAPYDTQFAKLKFQQPRSASMKGENLPSCAVPIVPPLFEKMPEYFGMIKCIDDNVGKILRALDAAGLAERTIVVFTSDHGDMCGEHGRINKGIPLEGSARIPFLIRAPGRVRPGTVVHAALATVDFKPTILGLMGLQGDAADEGRDASAILRAGQLPADWNNVAFSRNAEGRWLMAVNSRYKFIVSPDSEPCLFDLERDPFEMRNLFREPSSREVVRELAQSLLNYARKSREPHAEQPALRADLIWCAEGQGDYVAPPRAAARVPKGKGNRKKNKRTGGEEQ